MSPTPEASERARKAAFKAWETIRRKAVDKAKANARYPEIPEAKETASKIGNHVSKKRSRSAPIKASDYPENWEQIKAEIRERAMTTRRRVQCECRGECLKHRGRCEEIGRTWPRARRRRGKVKIRITTAHLCHTPKCDDKSHLRAMCEPCHQIYDLRCRQRGLRGLRAVRWAMAGGEETSRRVCCHLNQCAERHRIGPLTNYV